jgi:hypothetical protein
MSMIAKDINNIQRSVKCDTDGTLIVGGVTIQSATVNIIPTTSILSSKSVTTIPHSSTTALVDYTNTTGGLVLFDGFVAGGTVDAKFSMFINGTNTMALRSSEQSRNVMFFLPTPLRIENNGSVTIKVEHYNSSNTADFDNTIFGHIA